MCVTKRKGPLPSPDTFPDLLLTLVALSGELPSTLVSRLPGSDSYKAYTVKILKREKLLRTYYHDGLRGLRLTSIAKNLLAARQPDRYLSLFTGDTATNTPKYSVPHRLRLHRMAEVLVTAYNAGLLTFPWEKPAAFQAEPDDASLYVGPAYYSSREVKEIGAQATMIRGSRSTGILLCGSGIYAVYNTADTRMKWEYKAEVRLKAMMQTDLCHRRLADRFMDSPPGAIVFGDGMDQLEILMGQGDKETRNYLIMNGIFRCFHYLTLDHRGEVLLRLLCDPERKAALDGILSEDLAEGRSNWLIEHDAIDGNGCPVLFGYTCDMPRIRRFDDALGLHGQTGTVYCFDFQEPALRRVCGPRVALQSIDFEAFEGSVFHIPQTTD